MWFETGTPTFLVDLLRDNPVDLGDLKAPEKVFSTYDPADLAPLPLLVQTGYLTTKGATHEGRRTTFQLGFPNFGVDDKPSTRESYRREIARHLEAKGIANAIITEVTCLST